jgi:ABC-type transport system substrate-binding protein
VAQAIAADLSKIGIKVKVNAIPEQLPHGRQGRHQHGFAGWATNRPTPYASFALSPHV